MLYSTSQPSRCTSGSRSPRPRPRPLAADFGLGPEAVVEGCAGGREVCFLCFSPPTSGLARRRRRRGAQLDREFAFPASRRRRLRAWPGGGGGGAAYETESLLFIWSRPLLRPGDNGEGAYGHRVCIPAPLATEFGPMEAWLEGLLLRLALAGPAGDLKNALLRRRFGYYVADCA